MHRQFLFTTVIAVACLAACGRSEAASLEHNKDIVRRNAAAINDRDLAAIDSTMAEGLVRHSQATPGPDMTSLDEFKAFLQADWASFPDSRITIERMVAEGELVAIWGTYAGTQRGPMGPFPATDSAMSLDISGIFRIENDKIAEIWVVWDNLAGLTQLGLAPTPPTQ
jgi:steroid delta-isomerase-like uncharacterized protein